ncbi:MAG: hypothetical protein IJA26_06660 [Clostridia bacterium]|nr:hypothetical protein [Clostridia bacterium]
MGAITIGMPFIEFMFAFIRGKVRCSALHAIAGTYAGGFAAGAIGNRFGFIRAAGFTIPDASVGMGAVAVVIIPELAGKAFAAVSTGNSMFMYGAAKRVAIIAFKIAGKFVYLGCYKNSCFAFCFTKRAGHFSQRGGAQDKQRNSGKYKSQNNFFLHKQASFYR